MSDRELLEAAAKAAGYEINWEDFRDEGYGMQWTTEYWNPLTDDGDALRLAVKLGMIVSIINHPDLLQVEATAYPPDKRPQGRMATESLGTEHYAATRRAIVRAAAEVGRAMP